MKREDPHFNLKSLVTVAQGACHRKIISTEKHSSSRITKDIQHNRLIHSIELKKPKTVQLIFSPNDKNETKKVLTY